MFVFDGVVKKYKSAFFAVQYPIYNIVEAFGLHRTMPIIGTGHKGKIPFVTKIYSHRSCSFKISLTKRKRNTSGYATMVHCRRCNPHRCTTTFENVEITSLWRHWWRHSSETIRDRQKWRPPRAMKSSELSNGENLIALRQLLQNRKLRHLWRHNLGSRWKMQKMARENFSIGAFYNITKNQDNPIKTVGRDSFLSSETPKNTSF